MTVHISSLPNGPVPLRFRVFGCVTGMFPLHHIVYIGSRSHITVHSVVLLRKVVPPNAED